MALIEHVHHFGGIGVRHRIGELVRARFDQFMADTEQLIRIDAANHQVVVAVLLVVQVEATQASLLQEDGHDLLDVGTHRVVTGVHAHLRPLADVLAYAQRLAPVLDVGVIEGGLVELVLQEHAAVVGKRRINFAQRVDQPPAARTKVILTGVIGAVGEPDFDDAGTGLSRDLATFQDVRDCLLAHLEGRMTQRTEFVVFVLECVGVDASNSHSPLVRKRGQHGEIVDAVPRNVERNRLRYTGETPDDRRVFHLLERIAWHTALREDFEAGARVAVPPRWSLHRQLGDSRVHA